MSLQEQDIPEGFKWLDKSMPADIQSQVARQVEAQHRLTELTSLIEGKGWVADNSGNVIHAGVTERERELISGWFRFCIIDQMPPVDQRGRVAFSSWGSVISGAEIIYDGQTTRTSDFLQ